MKLHLVIFVGYPRGKIRYFISNAATVDNLVRDYWAECEMLLSKDEKEISTTLMILPNIALNFKDFESLIDYLDDCLSKSIENNDVEKLSDYIDNVYFHPEFKFVDKYQQNILLFDENNEIIGNLFDIAMC